MIIYREYLLTFFFGGGGGGGGGGDLLLLAADTDGPPAATDLDSLSKFSLPPNPPQSPGGPNFFF